MDPLKTAKITALLALSVLLGVLAWQAWAVPQQALAELRGLRADANTLSMETLREAVETRRLADERLKAIQADARAELRASREALDSRLESLEGIAAGELARANDNLERVALESAATIAAVRPVLSQAGATIEQAGPVLESANAALLNLNAIADDLYPDIKAGVETGIVAARSVAEAAAAVEAVAPTFTRNVDTAAASLPEIGANTAGLTKNLKQTTGLLPTIARGAWSAIKRIIPGI